MTIPSILHDCLTALRAPHERGFAMAKARLAVRINYNPQTILHWCAGRRPIGPHGMQTLRALHAELYPNHNGGTK